MPPPAAKIRSVEPSARQVGAACADVWPEENTGIAMHGLCANIGVSAAFADVTTLSSVSLNLLPIPLTCMWSAPASRQILCHAV